MTTRVVLAMSGGVDSSAAAQILLEQGYEVVGLFMRSGETEEETCAVESGSVLPVINTASHKQGCCSASDAADARRVADRLDIPFHAINFEKGFDRIKDYFADEYIAGRTPNPCVMCNNWLKFGKLWDFAQQVGAEKIATGHYAQIKPIDTINQLGDNYSAEKQQGENELGLFRGVDPGKDQSYVLFGIDPDLLKNILFPVGSYQKSEIRELARKTGLRVADKPDSQEICFIPDNDYVGFLKRYRGEQETAGELVDTAGAVLGHHNGYEKFTIGQRRGLGIAFGEPRYVVEINPDNRRVVIGLKDDLACGQLLANRLNFLVKPDKTCFNADTKIRYRHTASPAQIELMDNDEMKVTFETPQNGVAPGQAVVLYNGDRVLGGGWIDSGNHFNV